MTRHVRALVRRKPRECGMDGCLMCDPDACVRWPLVVADDPRCDSRTCGLGVRHG